MPVATATSLTSTPNPSAPGQNVVFTAAVTPSGATGIVTFKVDGVAAAQGGLYLGAVTFDTPGLTVGAHTVTAEYGGSTAYAPSVSAPLTQTVVDPSNRARSDLDGDGKSDILWRHTSGALYVWQMNGMALGDSSYLPEISTAWQIEGVGDFDGDGKADVLWREQASGNTYIWFMNGATATGSGYTASQADNTWTISGIGDMNGDGKDDILWRQSGGALYVWLMDGLNLGPGSAFLPVISNAWQIEGLGDFDGDGKADVLWREVVVSGNTYIWFMNGATATGTGYTESQADGTWTISDVGDMNDDGKDDVLWRHNGGAMYVWLMDGVSLGPGTAFLTAISTNWRIEGLGDFNGDGRADILWREAASGNTYAWLMDGAAAIGAGYTASQADNSWRIEAP